jgi:ribonuclease PH
LEATKKGSALFCGSEVCLPNAQNYTSLHFTSLKGDKRTLEMENNISEIAADTVMCELYPKAEITVLVQVIESDG